MNLPIVKYGHPVLRQKGARIEKVTPAIKRLIEDMLATMHAAAGQYRFSGVVMDVVRSRPFQNGGEEMD